MQRPAETPSMGHGGDLSEARARFGGEPTDWLDLSTGINPVSWPVSWPISSLGGGPASRFMPRLAHALVSSGAEADIAPLTDLADWTRLPCASSLAKLLAQARSAYQVAASLELVAASGTQAILPWLARLAPAGETAIVVPTYSGHHEAWTAAGRGLHSIATLDDVGDATVCILVSPNNPDGRLYDPRTLLSLAHTLGERGGLLIVDEAFADVAPHTSILPHVADEPVAVLRSFGKFYGLAGLRLGFMAAQPYLANRLSAALGNWAVSGPAISIATAALADAAWQKAARRRLATQAEDLDEIIHDNALSVIGGTSLFRLVQCGDASALHGALARRFIWTRRFSYRNDWLRIGLPGDICARDRFAQALRKAVSEVGATSC